MLDPAGPIDFPIASHAEIISDVGQDFHHKDKCYIRKG